MKLKTITTSLLLSFSLYALELHKVPPHITLAGENGGFFGSNKAWDSQSLVGDVHVLFYVDPDEKGVNEHYTKALKKFKQEHNYHFKNIAIINLAATWMPNVVLEKVLASKQKEFKDTLYVKDKNSVLVKKWNLKDDASNVIIFNKKGEVVFYKSGAMSQKDIQKSFEIIQEKISKLVYNFKKPS